ncbi:PREDICTED: ankyrin repeat domain-containing protein 54-like [Priapulus caudatus]|uniref:Ankyrin repeat domain-containing protein 54-like n=1 Tax=Priapulus caudatus TaxID=37621 RepID=A0ABM1E7F4_PRICU|nr:PREDICTED: ankyrin repeat domain-containing protein 54-like [Priapulus caudatus]
MMEKTREPSDVMPGQNRQFHSCISQVDSANPSATCTTTAPIIDEPKFDFSSWSPQPHPEVQALFVQARGSQEYSTKQWLESVGKLRAIARRRIERRKAVYSQFVSTLEARRLRIAASANDLDTVKELVNLHKVSPSQADLKGRTALHLACSKGHTSTVECLLNHGADVNCKDSLGNTPLHLAACTSNIPVITLLLKAGADVKVLDNRGCSPLQMVQSRLSMLSADRVSSSDELRNQIHQALTMMQEYMKLRGSTCQMDQLSELCKRLANTTTREQVDEVSGLLAKFTALNLQKS